MYIRDQLAGCLDANRFQMLSPAARKNARRRIMPPLHHCPLCGPARTDRIAAYGLPVTEAKVGLRRVLPAFEWVC